MRSDQILGLLPEIMQTGADRSSPLFALLEVMESMHAPAEEVLDGLDRYLDPLRCPDNFVPFLARWVALEWLVESSDAAFPIPTGVGRLRAVVAKASELSARRGTLRGMQDFFDTVAGPESVSVSEALAPFTVAIHLSDHAVAHRDFLVRVAEELKPAHVRMTVTHDEPTPTTPIEETT